MAQMVLIACKAPSGLILNLDRYEKTDDKGNVQKISGEMTVTLKGWSHAFNKPDHTAPTGGYALTPVPAGFWEQWIARNANSPLIVNKVILPPPAKGEATCQARDHAAVPKLNGPADIKDVAGIKKLEDAA